MAELSIKQYNALPLDIFDIIVLYVEYEVLLSFLSVNKYCNKKFNQNVFKKLRYECNPSAKDSMVHMNAIRLMNHIKNNYVENDEKKTFRYRQNSIFIELNEKYTDIYRRFAVPTDRLKEYNSWSRYNNLSRFSLQIVYHELNLKQYYLLRFAYDYGYGNYFVGEFTDNQIYDLLYMVMFFSDIRIECQTGKGIVSEVVRLASKLK